MWFAGEGERIKEGWIVVFLLLLALIIVGIGIYPTPVWEIVKRAGSDIFAVKVYINNVPLLGVVQ